MKAFLPLAQLCVLCGFLLTAPPAAQPRSAAPTDPQSRLDLLRPPEVRLRKLHLVRPDLIPYPIMYDVVC